MWWAPVQTVEDAVRDPQVEACGAFIDVPVGRTARRACWRRRSTSAITDRRPHGRVPEPGEHTEEVLLDLGYDWDAIAGLKTAGVIP